MNDPFPFNSPLDSILNYKSFRGDLPLLQELGLGPFEAKHGELLFLGVVTTVPNAEISVSVRAWPALFFYFNVKLIDSGTVYEVETGSGDLVTFWPKVKSLAEGTRSPDTKDDMFLVKIKTAHQREE